MHKISVIIPNYNRANVIGETIDALLEQTLKPYEIIVVDDGSTDHSLEVLKKYGDAIKVFTQENQGPGAARNKGIKEARGEFIQLMDSDDIPSLNKLEVQLKALLNQNADLVIGPWVRGWFNNRSFKPENVVLQSEGLPADKTFLDWFLTDWSMVFQQTLIRKAILVKVGLYDEQMKVMEDGDLFVKLLLADAKIVFEGESLTLYRLGHADKLTNSGASDIRKLRDHLYFYKKLIGYSNSLRVYEDARFQLKLFILSKELKSHGIEDQVLNKLIIKSPFLLQMLVIKEQLRKGLRQRIKGHRWSKAYRTSKLSAKHNEIINQLGYKLIS